MRKSFTLIEIVICAGILALVIGGVLYSYVVSLNTLKNLEYRTKALLFAEEILEKLKGYTLTQVLNNFDGAVFSYGDIDIRADVDLLEGTLTYPFLLKVTFTIDWPNVSVPLTLISYFTQR